MWLLQRFNAHLADSKNRGSDKLPPLYAQYGTFWFPQRSLSFLLNDGSLSPQHLFNARFFLWDPETLVDRIACPRCGDRLGRHTALPRPRRVVDLDSTFWLIGWRYRCRTCVNPDSKKQTVTFSSWDTRILQSLPTALAQEFPAYLSHRSGISKTAFAFMRSCFQNGMGAKQFADILCVQHTRKYDELHLEYLRAIESRRGMAAWRKETYSAFPTFDDRSAEGFRGFTPSSQWLRDMYDRFIEDHQHYLDQHTAMLSGEICAIDHSHKVLVVQPYRSLS